MFRKFVPIALSMILGGIIGFSAVWLMFQANVKGPMVIVYLLLIIVFYCCHIVIHEAGHAVFGLLTVYKLISLRMFNLMCVKDEQTNKIHFKMHHVPGTLGQCLIAPPNYVEGQFPFQLYLLGGVMVDELVSLLAIFFYKESVALGLFGIVGLFPVGTNFLPDGFNDGMILKIERVASKSILNLYVISVDVFME